MTERTLAWQVKLHRNGRIWTWNAHGWNGRGNIVRSAMGVVPRLSRASAERRANKAIDRIERRGIEDVTL